MIHLLAWYLSSSLIYAIMIAVTAFLTVVTIAKNGWGSQSEMDKEKNQKVIEELENNITSRLQASAVFALFALIPVIRTCVVVLLWYGAFAKKPEK